MMYLYPGYDFQLQEQTCFSWKKRRRYFASVAAMLGVLLAATGGTFAARPHSKKYFARGNIVAADPGLIPVARRCGGQR